MSIAIDRDLQAQPESVDESRVLGDREEPLEAVALRREGRNRLPEEREPRDEDERQQDEAERRRGGGVQRDASQRATVHLGPCLTPCPPALLPRSAPTGPRRRRGLWYTSRACPRWHRSIPPCAPGSSGASRSGPTEPQEAGWPAIAAGDDTLIAAPTGSGKTLAAFLVCIDRLLREAEVAGGCRGAPEVVYVSPLKALANDVQQNLEAPLAEIARDRARAGPRRCRRSASRLRTGDTPRPRAPRCCERPPHILVTTPESLYLLLTAERSRERLRGVRTVIVDEIHALARDKRGAHLALSLERLEALCGGRPVRIGLSATQRPIETDRAAARAAPARTTAPTARRLRDRRRRPPARARPRDRGARQRARGGRVARAVGRDARPASPSTWPQHRTTLVFVNTRRLAERVAHLLAERLGEDAVAAHHGSLSKERRLRVEQRLRAGELRALVATASLELGIDIGPVELVCQIGSPRSIATFLQRVGRSGHARGGDAEGPALPDSRATSWSSARRCCAPCAPGGSTASLPPWRRSTSSRSRSSPSARPRSGREDDALRARARAPRRTRTSRARTSTTSLEHAVARASRPGRGRRGAYAAPRPRQRRAARAARRAPRRAHLGRRDPRDGRLPRRRRPRRHRRRHGQRGLRDREHGRRRLPARQHVVADPARRARASCAWSTRRARRRRSRSGSARRRRAPPSSRRRSPQLRDDVGRACSRWTTRAAAQRLARGGVRRRARRPPPRSSRYLAAAHAALGVVPTQTGLVFERFFDEAGGMQLVVARAVRRPHQPRARPRRCASASAAASTSSCRRRPATTRSCSRSAPQHSFPLEDAAALPHVGHARSETLAQAVLAVADVRRCAGAGT